MTKPMTDGRLKEIRDAARGGDVFLIEACDEIRWLRKENERARELLKGWATINKEGFLSGDLVATRKFLKETEAHGDDS